MSRRVKKIAVMGVLALTGSLVGWLGSSPGHASGIGGGTCLSSLTAAVNADEPAGASTPLGAITTDRFASQELGLTATLVDADYQVYANTLASFDVRRIGGTWLVTAARKLGACGVDALTGEVLDMDVPLDDIAPDP